MKGQIVLVTGATGSLGQKIVEHLLKKQPKKIIVYSRDEKKQVDMERKWPAPKHPIRYFIGDVRDKDRLYRAFQDVDIVIHAAALKHVHIGEYNPFEFINTNVLGAQNIINAAIDCKVSKVLAVSSDKAVNPISLYGASKLCADKLFVAGNSYSGRGGTRFSVIRFGNFIGSRGSALSYFSELIQQGKTELPITDYRMTRFWIEIDDAAAMCFDAVKTMRGGEIFIPKMERKSIMQMVQSVWPTVDTYKIPMRPCEKIHEELITGSDTSYIYEKARFYIVCQEPRDGLGNPMVEGFTYTSEGSNG